MSYGINHQMGIKASREETYKTLPSEMLSGRIPRT
jgi:hypothetical protein